ncbi:internal scaffolding protein [Microviridae sp.]|nr:internal scaffolding protein [Microviridae sp.]
MPEKKDEATQVLISRNMQRIEKSQRAGKKFTQPSKTDKTGARNHQVTDILANYRAHGTRPRVTRSKPLYGDFTSARDLQSQKESFQDAQANFDALPAEVRRVAGNDLINFMEMIEDPTEEGMIALAEAGLEIEGFEIPEAEEDPAPEGNPPRPQPEAKPPVEGRPETPPGSPEA